MSQHVPFSGEKTKGLYNLYHLKQCHTPNFSSHTGKPAYWTYHRTVYITFSFIHDVTFFLRIDCVASCLNCVWPLKFSYSPTFLPSIYLTPTAISLLPIYLTACSHYSPLSFTMIKLIMKNIYKMQC